MCNSAAVILAGGRGKRMDILCDERPKPSLPFAGQFRVIDFSLSNCIRSKISSIAVLTDYQRSSMADYVRRWHQMNASQANLHILEPKSGSYNGTANAVYQNLDYLNENNVDMVLVLAGDHIYNLDYRKMLKFHQSMKADVTIGVIPVPIDQVHRFGTVTLGDNGRITDFVEKSPLSQSNLASMGIYIFNTATLVKYLMEDDGDPSSRHDFGYSIIPGMVKRDRVFAYKFDGYWQDIGTVEAYYEANMELTREYPGFSFDDTSSVLTAEKYLSSPRIENQAIVDNSLISPGCVIKGHVKNSILSPGVTVEENTIVRNSIIMENTYIGRNSIVNRSVLDEGIKIGNYCHVGLSSGLITDERNITVLGRRTKVPSYSTIRRGRIVLPDSGSADFVTDTSAPVEIGARYSKPGYQINIGQSGRHRSVHILPNMAGKI